MPRRGECTAGSPLLQLRVGLQVLDCSVTAGQHWSLSRPQGCAKADKGDSAEADPVEEAKCSFTEHSVDVCTACLCCLPAKDGDSRLQAGSSCICRLWALAFFRSAALGCRFD